MNVFLKTFREYGYIEGENLVIEYRSTGGRNERLPELVSELMRLKVNLMLVRAARNEADGVFRRFQELCGPEAMERSGIGGQALELACQPIGHTKCFGCEPRF